MKKFIEIIVAIIYIVTLIGIRYDIFNEFETVLVLVFDAIAFGYYVVYRGFFKEESPLRK